MECCIFPQEPCLIFCPRWRQIGAEPRCEQPLTASPNSWSMDFITAGALFYSLHVSGCWFTHIHRHAQGRFSASTSVQSTAGSRETTQVVRARQQTMEQRDKAVISQAEQHYTHHLSHRGRVPRQLYQWFCSGELSGRFGKSQHSYTGHKYAAAVTAAIFLNLSKQFGWIISPPISRYVFSMHWVSRQWRNELPPLLCMLKERVTLARNMLPDKTRHSSCTSLWQIAASQIYLKIQVFFLLLGKDCQQFFCKCPLW